MAGSSSTPVHRNKTPTHFKAMQHILHADLNPASHLLYGHICATYGPDETRIFWRRVIGVDTANLSAQANGNGERRIMLRNSPQSPAPLHALAGTADNWVVDYVPQFYLGPVVPQEPYVPAGTDDQVAPHYQGLRAPIWFVNTTGTVGISLENASSGRTDTLWGNQSLVLGVTRQSTYLSLKWHGYPEFPKQINLYDRGRGREPSQGVKYGQLAKKVANFVKDFLNEAEQSRRTHVWAVQNTAEFRSRILIIGLAHVTTGHYQPILQLYHANAGVALPV